MDPRIQEAARLTAKAARLIEAVEHDQSSTAVEDPKTSLLLKLMSRRKGVAITEASERLGLKPHSVRSLVSRKVRGVGYPVFVRDGRYYLKG